MARHSKENYELTPAEHLVWSMFMEFDTPAIYHMLTLLAEQEDVTAHEIHEAWRTFDDLRSTIGGSDAFR